MELRLLGKNSDDLGTQLEKLSKFFLKDLGFQNLHTNVVSSGGDEIDLRGSITQPSGQTRRVICECKAYTRPISMPDWEKFLGKVYLEEAETGREVYGCFIALSGLNGNVTGSYDSLKLQKDNITVYTGEDISKKIGSLFDSISPEESKKILSVYTDRAYTNSFLTFYENKIFFIFLFESGEYSILTQTGDPLIEEKYADTEFKKAVTTSLSAAYYIDLNHEQKRKKLIDHSSRCIIDILIKNDGSITKADLATCNSDEIILNESLEILSNNNLIIVDSYIRLCTNVGNSNTIIPFLNFYLSGPITPESFASSFLDELIDDNFVDAVTKIQGNLELNDSEKSEALSIIRWSPSALKWSINPDEMITVHRKKQPINESIDRHDLEYFFNVIYKHMTKDFTNPALSDYYFKKLNLVEVENISTIKIKSNQKNVFERTVIDRKGLGETAPEYGNKIVTLLLLTDAPQPWELRSNQ